MALPAPLRSPGRATLLLLILLTVTAAISGLAYKFLLGDLSDLWALLVTGLLVVTVGGTLVTRFIAWPLASRRVELFDTTQDSQTALSHDQAFRQQFAQLDADLAAATNESKVIEVLVAQLGSLGVSDLVELHVINAHDDTLDFVAANRPVVLPHQPASPWDCKAAVASQSIVTNSTGDADTCAHLASRVAVPVSAVSVPLTAQGGILGVLHATGPEGEPPTPTAVIILEAFASRAALNIALQRSAAEAWRPHIDPVTSLPTDDDVAVVAGRALAERRTQAVGWLSIDNLAQLEAGGSATTQSSKRLLASLLLSLLPVGSAVGSRVDGEFLFAVEIENSEASFADVVARLEHIRAAVAQRSGTGGPGVPDVTVSIGVVPSTRARTTVDLLAQARAALDHARKSGGNKVIRPGGNPS